MLKLSHLKTYQLTFANATLVICYAASLFTFTACKTRSQEERVAQLYCSSCHAFPDPTLLDKKTWENDVLPQMAFKMGFTNSELLSKIPANDLPAVLRTMPAAPMLTEQEFQLIKNYFIKHAPDSIVLPERMVKKTLNQFSVFSPSSFQKPFITLLKYDSARNKIFIGTRTSDLFALNSSFTIVDSTKLFSPPSSITFENEKIIISTMGIMDPNDQAKGQLLDLNTILSEPTIVLDSLQRPVYFQKTDLNNDAYTDIIVCAFGNVTGGLLLFEGRKNGTFTKHVMNNSPGARKVVVNDFDNDGEKDIIALMTQGDERLILYRNNGKMNFEETILLRFPPVYGSSYFEIHDFNNDGHFDILYTTGDNGDYSTILKPYHAVTIFENDGENNFKKKWSFAMPGASQAMANDFDKDGDLDLAAISFFPDFKKTPEQMFLYFENKGNENFVAHSTTLGSAGRWLVMEVADYDSDTDADIILGSMNFQGFSANSKIFDHWMQSKSSLLVLKNNLVSSHKK